MFRSAGVIRFVKHIELAKGGDMCLINALLIIIIIIAQPNAILPHVFGL